MSRLVRHSIAPAPRLSLAVFLGFLLLLPGQAFAHGALQSATPGNGDALSVAPTELRLTFTEALELAVSRLSLTGPNGPVELASLTLAPDSATVLIGAIEGTLVAGTYTVNWQAVGADGHPVRGEYTFSIAPDASGLAMAGPTAPAPTSVAPIAAETSSGADSSNSTVWVLGAVVIGAMGLAIFQIFMRRRDPEDAGESA